MDSFIARMLGRDDVDAINGMRLNFGADWAHDGPAWVLFGCLALAFPAAYFYLRYQPRASRRRRILLGFLRGTLLCLLLLILADPILEVAFTSHPRPVLWMVLDGTDSMNIEDRLTEEESDRLQKVADWTAPVAAPSDDQPATAVEKPAVATSPAVGSTEADAAVSRSDLVRAWLRQDGGKLLQELQERFRVQVFQFQKADEVTALELSSDPQADRTLAPEHLAQQFQASGSVTSLSAAFEDLRRRHAAGSLAGVVVVSDFNHNSGPAPLESAKRLGVPVFTAGVGAAQAIDLAVDLQTSLKMKKAESTTISVTLRQQQLEGTPVTVKVTAAAIEAGSDTASLRTISVGERTVTLTGPTSFLEFPFTPEESGRFAFTAEVEPVAGEIIEQNNSSAREVTVIDDFMRLLFVEYEPTWEWRFVKEVFHRDKLVGMDGFRTFLRSSDPIVREQNELFLPTVTLPRNEFFEYDVIFLGDMPASALSSRFGEMVREFVSTFGGGLVVIGGPRFGPGELAGTPIGNMLPVVVDADAQPRDASEFELQLTPLASSFDFMRLGATDADNAKAWGNLGKLPWYQPVRRIETSGTTVLAEHPTDKCVDGRTPQPLIAIRKYGRGEVIYLAFNEMWRLRRRYGELYYRQFWGQLIHRLGLSHALGSQKRFVVRTDRQQYQPDETVAVTVEAYDENFEPLTAESLDNRHLSGELWLPNADGTSSDTSQRRITLNEFRPGVFEARLPVSESGNYVLRVEDPVASETVDAFFAVADLSAERRSATRNRTLQENIATESGGRACELDTVRQTLESFQPVRLTETTIEVLPLWSTWLTFAAIVTLMLTEWLLRKLSHLT